MHLMIDLETLGTDTDCVVTQIGYCLFDIKGTTVDLRNELHLRPQEQINMGRKPSWATLQWWNAQSEDARKNMFAEAKLRYTLDEALAVFEREIYNKISWIDIEGVWSNGLNFDVAIMLDLYASIGRKVPWNFRAPRDTRTIWSLVPAGLIMYAKPTVAHSAVADAVCQAQNVQFAYKCLTQVFQANANAKVNPNANG